MFEYHGWLVIRGWGDGARDIDDSPDPAALRYIQELVDGLADNPPALLDLRWINGTRQLHFADTRNHYGSRVAEVMNVVREAARVAPGSYGIVYTYNDEDALHDDDFRVSVVRRGVIRDERDMFLSPFSEKVE